MQKDSVHLAAPTETSTDTRLQTAEPVAWRVDGMRNDKAEVWFYWKPEWPEKHKKQGDMVTPLYTHPAKATVPEGYAIVPIEPTLDMVNAGRSRIQNKEYVGDIDMMLAYGAMITAVNLGDGAVASQLNRSVPDDVWNFLQIVALADATPSNKYGDSIYKDRCLNHAEKAKQLLGDYECTTHQNTINAPCATNGSALTTENAPAADGLALIQETTRLATATENLVSANSKPQAK